MFDTYASNPAIDGLSYGEGGKKFKTSVSRVKAHLGVNGHPPHPGNGLSSSDSWFDTRDVTVVLDTFERCSSYIMAIILPASAPVAQQPTGERMSGFSPTKRCFQDTFPGTLLGSRRTLDGVYGWRLVKDRLRELKEFWQNSRQAPDIDQVLRDNSLYLTVSIFPNAASLDHGWDIRDQFQTSPVSATTTTLAAADIKTVSDSLSQLQIRHDMGGVVTKLLSILRNRWTKSHHPTHLGPENCPIRSKVESVDFASSFLYSCRILPKILISERKDLMESLWSCVVESLVNEFLDSSLTLMTLAPPDESICTTFSTSGYLVAFLYQRIQILKKVKVDPINKSQFEWVSFVLDFIGLKLSQYFRELIPSRDDDPLDGILLSYDQPGYLVCIVSDTSPDKSKIAAATNSTRNFETCHVGDLLQSIPDGVHHRIRPSRHHLGPSRTTAGGDPVETPIPSEDPRTRSPTTKKRNLDSSQWSAKDSSKRNKSGADSSHDDPFPKHTENMTT